MTSPAEKELGKIRKLRENMTCADCATQSQFGSPIHENMFANVARSHRLSFIRTDLNMDIASRAVLVGLVRRATFEGVDLPSRLSALDGSAALPSALAAGAAPSCNSNPPGVPRAHIHSGTGERCA